MRPFVLTGFILSIAFATLSFYFWSESAKKDSVISDLASKVSGLETDLAAAPQPSEGNHFIEVPNTVHEINCPMYLGETIGEGSHCSFYREYFPDNKDFVEWLGIGSVVGEYTSYERDDWQAVEAGAPVGTTITCHALKISESNPDFIDNDKNLLHLPFDELSLEEQATITEAEGSVKVTGLIRQKVHSVVRICSSEFSKVLSVSAE